MPQRREDSIDDIRMPLGDHLEELRRRILLGLIGPVIAIVFMLFVGKDLLVFLTLPLLVALDNAGQAAKIHFTSPTAAFMAYLKVSVIGGLIIGLPWLLYQLWKFVSLGLYRHERKFVYLLVPGSTLLSIAGLAFMYYIMLPVGLTYLINFSVDFPHPELRQNALDKLLVAPLAIDRDVPDLPAAVPTKLAEIPILKEHPATAMPGQMWIKYPEMTLHVQLNETHRLAYAPKEVGIVGLIIRLDEYIGFVIMMALAFVIGFQLPLVMLTLASVGIVSRKGMASVRKYAVLGCCIVGAALTPADPVSMLLLAIPLYGLYELGLILVAMVVKSKGWGEEDEDDDDHSGVRRELAPPPPAPSPAEPHDTPYDEAHDPYHDHDYHHSDDAYHRDIDHPAVPATPEPTPESEPAPEQEQGATDAEPSGSSAAPQESVQDESPMADEPPITPRRDDRAVKRGEAEDDSPPPPADESDEQADKP